MKTVGENEKEMRDLALDMMQTKYRFADKYASAGDLQKAKSLLESAEVWRVRARSHGANI